LFWTCSWGHGMATWLSIRKLQTSGREGGIPDFLVPNVVVSLSTAVTLVLFATSAATAQCTATTAPLAASATAGIVHGFAGFAGSMNELSAAINTSNTAFLTQSTAFIGSPATPQPDQLGGGVWARGIGGQTETKNTVTSNYSIGGVAVPGNIICNTKTRTDFAGVQVGSDLANLNVNGWNLHGGVTAGYMQPSARDVTAAGPVNPLGGTSTDSLQIPFAGIYAAATKGGFFVDGQIRWDFYQNELSDPVGSSIFSQHFDAHGLALTGNVGYNMPIGNDWFVEPSAGVIWSRVRVDPINLSGGATLGVLTTAPATALVDDIDSTIGRLSVRVGTSVSAGDWTLHPFATVGVYHEFQGTVTTNLTSNWPAIAALDPRLSFVAPPLFPVTAGTLNADGLGTYGQFSLGLSGDLAHTGWLGYIRADYRIGDQVEGWGLNGGLRYQLASGTSPSGPMITKAPVYKAAAVYNWTGFYIGADLGATYGFDDWTMSALGGTATSPRFAGILGGGQVGYNYQVGKWVFGINAGFDGTNARGAQACGNAASSFFFFTCEVNVNDLFTGTARIGYAYWDRVLLYVNGGVAVGQVRAQVVCNTDSQPILPQPPGVAPFSLFGFGCPIEGAMNARAGWTVGWGTELGLTPNWSVKGETRYFDLGTDHYTLAGGLPIIADIRTNGFISTIGLNYRFAVR
jgi:outer membrane autotransporter protein